jgi:predicted AAA+ superfamily ATPase
LGVAPETFAGHPLLAPYNLWWGGPDAAFARLPIFRRDVFGELYADVKALPQMLSITGPRRVGKSTLLLQCIRELIRDAADPIAQASRIAYFSMDDPALELPGFDRDRFFNDLVATAANMAESGPVYLFLDEIQRFPRWELYLKKFYDLKTPVRFVVSGSASTPIFRKSRESLLGRIKDFHALPFSFREWLFCRVGIEPAVTSDHIHRLGREIRSLEADELVLLLNTWGKNTALTRVVPDFLFEGGFPEAWDLPTLVAKQEYLYQNQVERVIFEDLLVAAEFRKPEMLRRFYLGLLRDPGRETNLSQLSKDIELARSTIESYFPLLEATDLVWRLQKHTSTKATPKAGNFKTYLVDLAVRNAVLKFSREQLLADAPLMGNYAENVVANHLRAWPGLVELGYWRRNNDELDFIVDLGHTRIGVEVKYRNDVQDKDVLKAARLAAELKCDACIVVGKDAWSADTREKLSVQAPIPIALLPLADLLMLF